MCHLLPPANEVCKGYVFTRICHSVHRGGLPQCMLEYTPLADNPRANNPPWADTPRPDTSPSPFRQLLLRTIRILLECILVMIAVGEEGYTSLSCWSFVKSHLRLSAWFVCFCLYFFGISTRVQSCLKLDWFVLF